MGLSNPMRPMNTDSHPFWKRQNNIAMVDKQLRLPFIVQPDKQGVGAEGLMNLWRNNREHLLNQMHQYGALLFRGFDISEPGIFASVIKHLGKKFAGYVGGNTPRARISSGIYSSTEYPPEFFIPLHNELSYFPAWPRRIFFCCAGERWR